MLGLFLRSMDPHQVTPSYYGLALITAIIVLFIWNRQCVQAHIKVKQGISAAILSAYSVLVLSSTVLCRIPRSNYAYKVIPFWSYPEIVKGNKFIFVEVVMNGIMLLPVGFLFPVMMGRPCFKMTVVCSFFFSLSIELLQLVTRRGFFEFDDIFHNTLGALIGYGLWKGWNVLHGKKLADTAGGETDEE